MSKLSKSEIKQEQTQYTAQLKAWKYNKHLMITRQYGGETDVKTYIIASTDAVDQEWANTHLNHSPAYIRSHSGQDDALYYYNKNIPLWKKIEYISNEDLITFDSDIIQNKHEERELSSEELKIVFDWTKRPATQLIGAVSEFFQQQIDFNAKIQYFNNALTLALEQPSVHSYLNQNTDDARVMTEYLRHLTCLIKQEKSLFYLFENPNTPYDIIFQKFNEYFSSSEYAEASRIYAALASAEVRIQRIFECIPSVFKPIKFSIVDKSHNTDNVLQNNTFLLKYDPQKPVLDYYAGTEEIKGLFGTSTHMKIIKNIHNDQKDLVKLLEHDLFKNNNHILTRSVSALDNPQLNAIRETIKLKLKNSVPSTTIFDEFDEKYQDLSSVTIKFTQRMPQLGLLLKEIHKFNEKLQTVLIKPEEYNYISLDLNVANQENMAALHEKLENYAKEQLQNILPYLLTLHYTYKTSSADSKHEIIASHLNRYIEHLLVQGYPNYFEFNSKKNFIFKNNLGKQAQTIQALLQQAFYPNKRKSDSIDFLHLNSAALKELNTIDQNPLWIVLEAIIQEGTAVIPISHIGIEDTAVQDGSDSDSDVEKMIETSVFTAQEKQTAYINAINMLQNKHLMSQEYYWIALKVLYTLAGQYELDPFVNITELQPFQVAELESIKKEATIQHLKKMYEDKIREQNALIEETSKINTEQKIRLDQRFAATSISIAYLRSKVRKLKEENKASIVEEQLVKNELAQAYQNVYKYESELKNLETQLQIQLEQIEKQNNSYQQEVVNLGEELLHVRSMQPQHATFDELSNRFKNHFNDVTNSTGIHLILKEIEDLKKKTAYDDHIKLTILKDKIMSITESRINRSLSKISLCGFFMPGRHEKVQKFYDSVTSEAGNWNYVL